MQTMAKDRTNGIIRDKIERKAGTHGSLDDPRGARWGVCGRLARSQRHWHRLGFRRRGYRQHEPRANQSRLRLGSPHREQAEGCCQRRPGLPLRALDGQGSTIVMYNPAERLYHIGTIEGPCTSASEPESVTYTRAASWHETAPRDVLALASKSSRGSVVHRRSEGERSWALRLHGRLHQGGTLRG